MDRQVRVASGASLGFSRERSGKGILLGLISGGICLTILSGCSSTSTMTNPSGGQSSHAGSEVQPSHAAAGPTSVKNSEAERILNDPNRVSPQEIAKMTPEELAKFATISYDSAPTPEAFAKRFAVIYDAWMNSGATKQEFTPYENAAKGVYEKAMSDKYDGVFIKSLFGISDLDGFKKLHSSTMNSFMLSDGSYSLGTIFKGVDIISDSGTSNGFRVVIHMDIANNPEESGVSEFNHAKDTVSTLLLELNVGSIDGNYKIMSAENLSDKK